MNLNHSKGLYLLWKKHATIVFLIFGRLFNYFVFRLVFQNKSEAGNVIQLTQKEKPWWYSYLNLHNNIPQSDIKPN